MNDRVQEVLKRDNQNKMEELKFFENSKSKHLNFSHKQYCIERSRFVEFNRDELAFIGPKNNFVRRNMAKSN